MSGSQDALERLAAVLESRRGGDPAVSYVARLFAKAPDAILKEVWQRTGDKPFARIEDVMSADEMAAITNRYKKVAGYDRQSLEAKRAAG